MDKIKLYTDSKKFNKKLYKNRRRQTTSVMGSFDINKNETSINLPKIWQKACYDKPEIYFKSPIEVKDWFEHQFINGFTVNMAHESIHKAMHKLVGHKKLEELTFPHTSQEIITRRMVGEKFEFDIIPYVIKDIIIKQLIPEFNMFRIIKEQQRKMYLVSLLYFFALIILLSFFPSTFITINAFAWVLIMMFIYWRWK